MFGRHIDYCLLRPLVHGHNRATEEELDEEFRDESVDLDAAHKRVQNLIGHFDGQFPLDPNLRYLDVGCGMGDIAIALAKSGCGSVDGVDAIQRCVDGATHRPARTGVEDRVKFHCVDIHEFVSNRPYDVVLSHEALEHIHNPDAFLKSLVKMVAPGGTAFLAFGPLFHSPMGDHMHEFFRIPVPWRGAVFSEKALLRLRREFFRPGDPVDRFEDIRGGLNRMRYSQFLAHVRQAGWDIQYLAINPQLRKIPLLHSLSKSLVRIPGIRDYVAMHVYCMLRRQHDA